MTTDKRTQAVLLLIITAYSGAWADVLIKWVSLPPLAIAGYRSAIALPVLLIYFKRQALNFSPLQLIGGASYAATVILFVYATKLTTAGNAILLQYTAPVFVALFSGWLLNEKIRWFDWAAIAAVLMRHVDVFMDQLSSGADDRQYAGGPLRFELCFSGSLHAQTEGRIACRLRHPGQPVYRPCLPALDGRVVPGEPDWGVLMLLGVFQLGLSYICYAVAIKKVTAMEGILIPMLEPILNPLWAFIFLGERLGLWALFGGFVVILSILFRNIMNSKVVFSLKMWYENKKW